MTTSTGRSAKPLLIQPLDVLSTELRVVCRRGLPVTLKTAGTVLPNLRGVWARSVLPDDYVSRVDALNKLLIRIVTELADERLGDPVRVLFALEARNRGTTLGRRREVAAELAGYEVTHFRKVVEPKIIELVALALHADSIGYEPRTKRTAEEPPKQDISGDTPRLDSGHANEQEELVSRIWSAVYGLRAEMIALARTKDVALFAQEHHYAQESALWQTARVSTFVGQYVETYGETLMHGETEFNAEGVIRLAGWMPEGMTVQERQRLRFVMASVGAEERSLFVNDWTCRIAPM
jgi:hypothetical protein